MPKKLSDIKKEKKGKVIVLKGHMQKSRRLKKWKKDKNVLYKSSDPINSVNDIKGATPLHFKYVKGENFTPPAYIGNVLKIAVFGFVIIFVMNLLNVYFQGKALEKEISDIAFEGYSQLIDAGKNATKIQFAESLKAFDNALTNFSHAEESLWFINRDNSFYAEDNDIGYAVDSMLEGGKYFAMSGGYFLEALEEFNKIPIYFVTKNEEVGDEEPIEVPSITDTLKTGLEKTDLAIEMILLASEEIGSVNEDILPPEISVRVKFAKEQIEIVNGVLQSTSSHFPALLKLLGDRYPHRYLILLQNNQEIRPTGGFIGSYGIMDVNEGYIEKLKIYDVYDIDGSYGEIIEPPEELKEFTTNWRFRDSNYHPDFAVSAEKARWFLQEEGGPSVDTVIGINQGLLEDLLEITGPIQVGNFGKLNSENYNLLLSYVIEGKVWGEEDPKHILKIFIPEFKKEIIKEENLAKLSSKLYKAVQQKHITMWSSDEEIQALFDATGMSGRMEETREKEDYLSVIHAATGGTKSEQFIEEEITHHTNIAENGEIIDEIKIKRAHKWDDNIYYEWKRTLNNYGFKDMPDDLIDILGRGANKVSTRIYVPEGSELLDSNKNVETIYDTMSKRTYFFTDMMAEEGKNDELYIKYRLPFKLEGEPIMTYRLTVDKQSGSRGSIFTKTLEVNGNAENLAIYPAEARLTENGEIMYATNLVYDRYFSTLWKK